MTNKITKKEFERIISELNKDALEAKVKWFYYSELEEIATNEVEKRCNREKRMIYYQQYESFREAVARLEAEITLT